MRLSNFRSYQLAKDLYRACLNQPVKGYARDQLHRASHSICLNLAEGTAKPNQKERRRFYTMALASLREVQACIDLHGLDIEKEADHLGANIFKLIQKLDG